VELCCHAGRGEYECFNRMNLLFFNISFDLTVFLANMFCVS